MWLWNVQHKEIFFISSTIIPSFYVILICNCNANKRIWIAVNPFKHKLPPCWSREWSDPISWRQPLQKLNSDSNVCICQRQQVCICLSFPALRCCSEPDLGLIGDALKLRDSSSLKSFPSVLLFPGWAAGEHFCGKQVSLNSIAHPRASKGAAWAPC